MGGTIPTNGLKWSNPFRFCILNETFMYIYIFTFWDLLDAGNSIQKGTCILAAQNVILYVLPQHFWRLQVMQRKWVLNCKGTTCPHQCQVLNDLEKHVLPIALPKVISINNDSFDIPFAMDPSFLPTFPCWKAEKSSTYATKISQSFETPMFGPFCGVAF